MIDLGRMVEGVTLVMIRLIDRTQLIGVLKESSHEDFVSFTKVLNIMGARPMKYDDKKQLSDLSDAEKTAKTYSEENVRNVPIMNLPDESIMTSVSITEAFEKVWSFNRSMISFGVEVSPESVYGRFYKVTIEELMNNRDVSRRIFRYTDLSNDVAKAIYNEETAKKIFKNSEK